MSPHVYLITTCFPPDVGGIEEYCHGLVANCRPTRSR